MNEMKGEKHVLYDVFVLEFLQEADFPNSGGGDAFILCLETDFLQCDNLVCGDITSFVYNTVGT